MDNFFKQYQAQTNLEPLSLKIVRAEGCYLYGENDERYIDFVAGLAVNNVGHCHPQVISAVKEQVDKYLHVMPYGEFIQEPQTKLAKKLSDLLPENLTTTYFVNSGAEAIEGAIKLAKRHTGRQQIIACHKSYHGSTLGALSISGNKIKQKPFEPLLPNVNFITFNDVADLENITENTAAVIIETIQGDAGVRIPTKQYMQALRNRCTQTGTLLILDEIQAGMGRTGKLFAFEHFNISPDVLCLAKALGGGMPMGSFTSSHKIMHSLAHNPPLGHITTFGGHPVSCAAAIASIDVIQNDLLSDVEEKGALIKTLLTHPIVKEIRQIGLMMAIDLPSPEITYKVVKNCIDKGVITFWFLSCPASFRISPPLTITKEQITEACKVITEVFDELFEKE